MIKHCVIVLLSLLLSLVSGAVYAQYCTTDCVPVGRWQINLGVGAGWRSNPLHQGKEGPMILLPEVNYYGKRFFIKNLEFGWNLFENRRHQFNLLVTPGSDQMFFNRWDPYNLFDANGAKGSFNSTSAAPYRIGRLDVRGAPLDTTGAVGAGSEEGADAGSPPSPGSPDWSQVPLESFDGVEYLSINGQLIDLAGDSTLRGRAGNTITVSRGDETWVVQGLDEGDNLQILTAGDNANGEVPQAAIYQELVFSNGQFEVVERDTADSAAPPFGSGHDGESTLGETQGKLAADQAADRKMAGLAGLEYLYSTEHFDIHTQALVDVTGVHQGHELRIAGIFPWEMARSRWALTLGLSYKSEEILDYYYGVREEDAGGALLYQPTASGVASMVRLDWQKPLSEHWSLRGMIQSTRLAKEIHDSPLVSDSVVNAFFFGGVYHF